MAALRTQLHASYGQWAARSAGLAQRLQAAGLQPGGRVMLFMRNHPRYLEVLWGAWWAGLVVVPVNAKLHTREVEWIIDNAQARWAFVTGDVAPHRWRGWRTRSRSKAEKPTNFWQRRQTRWSCRCVRVNRATWPGCFTPAAPPAAPRA